MGGASPGPVRTLSQDRREARGKSRSRGLAAIDPKFISQVRGVLMVGLNLDPFSHRRFG